MAKPCNCGSGLDRYDLVDGAGIFCAFVCDRCEDEKRKKFNPAIFNSKRYASSGEEADLWADDYDNETEN